MSGTDDDVEAIDVPNIDLSGVHPLRREKTRLRAQAAIEWLGITNPTPEDEASAASRLGLGVAGFRNIITNWMIYRQARLLPGARIAISRPRRLRPTVREPAERIVSDVIAEFGTALRPKDVFDEVLRRCAADRLKAPSKNTVARRLYRARADQLAFQGGSGLYVDHCAVRLPVRHEGLVRAPVASIVFDASGRILSHRLRVGGPVPQAAAAVLAEALRWPAAADAPVELHLNGDFTPGWNALLNALELAHVCRNGTKAAPVPSSRHLRARYGDVIGNIALLPLLTHSSSEPAAVRRLQLQPLSLREADDAMRDAVRLQNVGIGPPTTRPRLAADGDELLLMAELERIASEVSEMPRQRRKGG